MVSLISTFILSCYMFTQSFIDYHNIPEHRQKYVYMVALESVKQNIDPKLVLTLVMTESSFRPTITSYAGAYGLFQLMPIHKTEVDIYNEYDHIKYGILYLKSLITKYDGDINQALRYYNGGWRAKESRAAYKYAEKILNNL